MYVQLEEKVKCSNCGATNRYETVTRKELSSIKTIIRCLHCKHEKIQSELTYSNPGSNDNHIIYNRINTEREF